MTIKQKLNIVHGRTKLHAILNQMEQLNTLYNSQSEI